MRFQVSRQYGARGKGGEAWIVTDRGRVDRGVPRTHFYTDKRKKVRREHEAR